MWEWRRTFKDGYPTTMPEKSPHTSKFLPWKLVTYVAFSDEQKARTFQRYLKSGSGHAFAGKRLW